MGLTLAASSLLSRATRHRIGQRFLTLKPVQSVVKNGKASAVLNFANRYRGFLVGFGLAILPSLTWTLSSLWDLFTQSLLELYYFDWNQPDEQLDQQAQQQWNAYGSILGGTVGNALGYFVCGIVPATSMFAFNRDLATYVLREVSQEAAEEITANLANALRLATRNLVRQSFGWLYKGARRWLKDPNNPVLEIIFPGRANEIREQWGTTNAPPWTFAEQIEQRVEKIPSAFWRNFTEELIDEALDACIEAGYVVANAAETYYARQRLAEAFTREPARVVELTPDRANDRETIILAGPESAVRGHLTGTLAHYQLIEHRDVGQIIGMPQDDYVRDRPLTLRLKFQLYRFSNPPFRRRNGEGFNPVTITVPDVKRSALNWQTLRLAVGGANGYLWGRWKAKGRIEGRRYVTVYGATESEAEQRLTAVMALSEATLQTINITEELKAGERLTNPKLQKDPIRIYPGHVTIINRQRVIAIDQGRGSVDGNYADRHARFDLWRETPPPDFSERVAELLRFSD
jgi:hypothetical protein